MTVRFVLDESSWASASAIDVETLSGAIQQLLERLDTARERNEGVVKHTDYYEVPLGDGVQLFSALFDPSCKVELDRDLAERLRLALDRVEDFADPDQFTSQAKYEGNVRFAPGAAWAHTCCSQRRHVAILPLPLDGVPRGPVPVTVNGTKVEIFFVTDESQHVHFFRSVIALENADEVMFKNLASSAFPTLEWADDIWSGLRRFSRPYIDVRDELVRCLGGLSDHGAACFCQYRAVGSDHLQRVLSALVGFETSDENGRTKSHRPSEQDRTRRHLGTNKVFWWHVKLRPNVDRVHFLYEPPLASSPLPGHGRIIVGLFKDHCTLPN